jgi:hypothetical protein
MEPVEYKFQKFDKRTSRLVKRPELTIQAKGTLSLNAAAHHLIGSPEAVELLYDEENKVIGLRPVSPEDPDAYPVRPIGGGGTYVLSGRAFLKWFDIDFGTPTRREVTVVNGVLIVDLKDPGRDATSNRTRAKERAAAAAAATVPENSGVAPPD